MNAWIEALKPGDKVIVVTYGCRGVSEHVTKVKRINKSSIVTETGKFKIDSGYDIGVYARSHLEEYEEERGNKIKERCFRIYVKLKLRNAKLDDLTVDQLQRIIKVLDEKGD